MIEEDVFHYLLAGTQPFIMTLARGMKEKIDTDLKAHHPACGTAPGRRKIEVKVVDIFGNDTMTIVDVSVGKNGGRK